MDLVVAVGVQYTIQGQVDRCAPRMIGDRGRGGTRPVTRKRPTPSVTKFLRKRGLVGIWQSDVYPPPVRGEPSRFSMYSLPAEARPVLKEPSDGLGTGRVMADGRDWCADRGSSFAKIGA